MFRVGDKAGNHQKERGRPRFSEYLLPLRVIWETCAFRRGVFWKWSAGRKNAIGRPLLLAAAYASRRLVFATTDTPGRSGRFGRCLIKRQIRDPA